MAKNQIYQRKVTDKGAMRFGRTHKIINEQESYFPSDKGQWRYSLKAEYGLSFFLTAKSGSLNKEAEGLLKAIDPGLASHSWLDIYGEKEEFNEDDPISFIDRMALVTLTVESAPKAIRDHGVVYRRRPKSFRVWLPLLKKDRKCYNMNMQGWDYDGLTASLVFGVCYYEALYELYFQHGDKEQGDHYLDCFHLLKEVAKCYNPKSCSVLN